MRVSRLLLAGLALLLGVPSHAAIGGDIFAEATGGQSRVITPEYFGIHFHRLVLTPQEKAVRTTWPPLSFGSLRLSDSVTRWADVAPNPGQWEFDRLDTYVAAAQAHQTSVLYTLGSTPRWVSKRPEERCPYGFGCAAEPVRMAHWEEYVRRVAQRYRGLIETFELWNEPSFSDFPQDRAQPVAFFSGNAADMVEMARLARKALDETSPRARLATPGFLGGGQRHLDLFLGSGGKNYVQVIAYHFYASNAEEFVRKVLDVRAIVRRHGVDKLPLWNTESGFEIWPEGEPLPPGVKEHLDNAGVGARTAQMLVLGAAAGLERFYYFAWDNDRSGMVTRSGDRLPSYAAAARVQEWLIGARMMGCSSVSPGAVSCQGEIKQQPFLVAWSDRPGEQSIKLPRNYEVEGVDPLFPEGPSPSYAVRNGQLRLTLGMAPVRILLTRRALP